MDYLLEETVPAAELKKFESRYMNELDTDGKVAAGTQFEYAWCLVRSKYPADIRKGIALPEDLFQVGGILQYCAAHPTNQVIEEKWMGLFSTESYNHIGKFLKQMHQHLFDDAKYLSAPSMED